MNKHSTNKNIYDKLEVEGINSNGYGIMPKIIMQDNRLTIEAKAIYAYIVSFAGAGNTAFPSLKKILFDLNISENRFYKHRKQLIDCNYITLKQLRNEKKEIIKNVYTLVSNPKIGKEGGTLQNEGYPIPQNEGYPIPQNEGHIINNSKINSIKINNKQIDTEKSDTRKQQQENYLLNHFAETHEEYSFLNRQNLELIGLFSDSLADAENMQGIILRAKKEIEKKHEAVLVLDEGYIHDEALAIQEEIEKILRRIYQKRKTDSTIKNIDNYTYGAFKNLFEQKLGELSMLSSENVSTIATHDWVN